MLCTELQNTDFVYCRLAQEVLYVVKCGTFSRKRPSYHSGETEYERCILCGKQTDVKRVGHIELRTCYAEDAVSFARCVGSKFTTAMRKKKFVHIEKTADQKAKK